MSFTGDFCYSYAPDVSTASNLSEPRNPFYLLLDQKNELWCYGIHQLRQKVKVGPSPPAKHHPYREIIYVQYYPPQHLWYQRSPWCFKVFFTIQSHNVTHCQASVSDCDLRLYTKIPHRFSPDLCHSDPNVLFVLCICGCKGDQLLNALSLMCVFFVFFWTVTSARCNQVFYFIFISLTVICLTESDTSKRNVNMSSIKARPFQAFWQLSLRRNDMFRAERGTAGRNCQSHNGWSRLSHSLSEKPQRCPQLQDICHFH